MKVSTKKDKNSAAVVTNVTIVWDSPSNERALATQAAIVKWQGTVRKGTIPTEATIKISEYGPGTRHTGPVDIKAEIKAMTSEQKAALIKELQEQV